MRTLPSCSVAPQETQLAGVHRALAGVIGGEPRPQDLRANEFGAGDVGLAALFLEPVGANQPRPVVVGRPQDGLDQRGAFGGHAPYVVSRMNWHQPDTGRPPASQSPHGIIATRTGPAGARDGG